MNSTNHALHVYYILRDQQAFQKLLEPSKHRVGRSLRGPGQTSGSTIDVNARDALGRTVLHLSCSDPSPPSLEFVKLLLAHPDINLNVQDYESRWTAMHRAGYAGNVAACVLLLQGGADPTIPDMEGLLAFDLYNSTIEGGFPGSSAMFGRNQLLTWGSNRNGVLCHQDGADRPLPEQVSLRREDTSQNSHVMDRFGTLEFCFISMAKLHTVILTRRSCDNLRICGFGSGGRLGALTNTQYKPLPLSSAMPKIKSVALGQDHTVALSENGIVYSWGLNRFAQLGYILDSPKPGAEPIQASPRKIQGPLKKESTIGVAACKTASACWTSDGHLFTWGTNDGQLGYNSLIHTVQILPKVVSSIEFQVVGIALTEFAMACLSPNGDVVCFTGNVHFRLSFNAAAQSSLKFQRHSRVSIHKALGSDDKLAFISRVGDVFILSATDVAQDGTKSSLIRPRRIWNRTHESRTAHDIALGSDGSLLICTMGGHVYAQVKQTKLIGRGSKFRRVPFVQRALAIRANTTGSFASLRHEFVPSPVNREIRRISDDFWHLLQAVIPEVPKNIARDPGLDEDDLEDQGAAKQRLVCQQCLQAISPLGERASQTTTFRFCRQFSEDEMLVKCEKLQFVIHRSLLYSRCPELTRPAVNRSRNSINIYSVSGEHGSYQTVFTGCHPVSVLLLLIYLYTDEVIAIWDSRISIVLRASGLPVSPRQVHKETQDISALLQLAELETAVRSSSIQYPQPTLSSDMRRIYEILCRDISDPPPKHFCDVKLTFEDRPFYCASCVLQARSPYFAAFFGDQTWTTSRTNPAGFVEILLTHMKWRSAKLAFAHIYYGAQEELFDMVEHANSADELVDFVFEVLSVANELLLDDLQTACVNVILRFLGMQNFAAILTEAAHLGVEILLAKLYHYVAVNLETLLAYSIMDDVPPDLLTRIGQGVQMHQKEYSPFVRSGAGLQDALLRHEFWLEHQDFPRPTLPGRGGIARPRLANSGVPNSGQQPLDHVGTEDPAVRKGSSATIEEYASRQDGVPIPSTNPVWKAHSASISNRTSLRSIMLEAERDMSRNTADSPIHSTFKKSTGSSRSNAKETDGDTVAGDHDREAGSMELPTAKPANNIKPPGEPVSRSPHTAFPMAIGTLTPPNRPRGSAGNRPAWSQLTAESPSSPPETRINRSFLEIQSEQQKSRETPSQKSRMGIRDIQQEEEAHQQEAEFLKWWAAEEERVRNELIAVPVPNVQHGDGRKSRSERGERNGRVGRGMRGKRGREVLREGKEAQSM